MQTSHENDLSDADVLEAAGKLVDAFLSTIREHTPGNDILDTDLLPGSKVSIENGFRLAIATEPRVHVRRRLVAAGKVLAQFQNAVGSRISLKPAARNGPEGWFGTVSSPHLEKLVASMERDTMRLSAMLETANELARRRFEVSVPPGFQDDGTYTWHGHGRPH